MKHVTHIISLPRCRTAWLSQALTHAPLCYGLHDGVSDHNGNGVLSEADYVRKIMSLPEMFVTDCSSGIPAYPDHLSVFNGGIIAIMPDNEDRCRDSLIAHMGDPSIADRWDGIVTGFRQCLDFFNHRIVLRVPFAQITDFMPSIWNVCCPGVPYPDRRIHDLTRLNINEIN